MEQVTKSLCEKKRCGLGLHKVNTERRVRGRANGATGVAWMTRTSQKHCLNCADEPKRCYRTDVEREKPIFYKVSEIPLQVLEGVNRPLLPDELEEMMNMSAMHAAE